MFRERPALAALLLGGPLHGGIPDYDEVHLSSADLPDVVPTEYRADAVVTLTRGGADVLAVVVEVQLRPDARKLLSWPAYVATLHARLGCQVALLVVCPNQNVVDWAKGPIDLGPPGSVVTPVAVGPGQTPVITDPEIARQYPELAVLSTVAHIGEQDPEPLIKAFVAALDSLESDRGLLYHDFVLSALSNATRKLLEEHMIKPGYQYTSDWARGLLAKGEAKGEANAVLTVLAARGVEVPDEARSVITDCTDLDQLRDWIQRAVTAERVEDLGGALGG